MTKLLQWLLGGLIFLGAWLALLANIFESSLIQDHRQTVVCLPLIVIGAFGLYAATVVLWRVYTFNDCEEAAKELQQFGNLHKMDLRDGKSDFIIRLFANVKEKSKQILEAREDLTKRGFVFKAVSKKID